MAYVLINGSFGVGKTTVARELRELLPRSAVFDPELIGFVLKRVPGYSAFDYRDSKLWRRLSAVGAKLIGIGARVVIIPMAFSQTEYLDEIRAALGSGGRPVLHYCLVAPLSAVRERLTDRGEPFGDPRWSWVHRRASECCAAHASMAFATHVATLGREPSAIAAQLATEIEKYVS